LTLIGFIKKEKQTDNITHNDNFYGQQHRFGKGSWGWIIAQL
jgi:hypothetical protein